MSAFEHKMTETDLISPTSTSPDPGDNIDNLSPESRIKNPLEWLKRQQLKLALGAVALSTAINYSGEYGRLESKAIEAGPWVGAGLLASEITWWGGAALMAAGVGVKISNPLKLSRTWNEIKDKANDSPKFKTGMIVSGIGAIGLDAIPAAAAITELPADAWAFLGPSTALGVGSTLWIRKIMIDRIRENKAKRSGADAEEIYKKKERTPKISVRHANKADMPRLAQIGKTRYKRTYTENEPVDEDVTEMFEKRLENTTPQWMLVCEIDGKIEGSVSGFRTDQPWEDFVSWEDSTASGTLDGKVHPDGQYVYIVHLTVNPEAVKHGAVEMLMANLMAEGIKEGVEYGYFVSRMPLFSAWLRRWARENNTKVSAISATQLDTLAQEYVGLKENIDGKEVSKDYELRMYEEFGLEKGRLVKDAYSDPQSMNYGVLFRAPVPPHNVLKKIPPVRHALGSLLKVVAKNPKILDKLP